MVEDQGLERMAEGRGEWLRTMIEQTVLYGPSLQMMK